MAVQPVSFGSKCFLLGSLSFRTILIFLVIWYCYSLSGFRLFFGFAMDDWCVFSLGESAKSALARLILFENEFFSSLC